MEIRPTREEIALARSVAFGETEDYMTEEWAKPIREELREIEKQWEKLSEDAKAMIEMRLDRTADFGDSLPDIGAAIRQTVEEFGSSIAHRSGNLPGLRGAVGSLWKAYKARVPGGGMGKLKPGAPRYPALRFVREGVKAIWPERYEGRDEQLDREVDSQLRALAYPGKKNLASKTPSKND